MSHPRLTPELAPGGRENAETLDVLLPALGSAGDVFPIIELGIGLEARGHHSTIITSAVFEEDVRHAGLDFIQLGTIDEANVIFADPRLLHPTKCYECLAQLVLLPYVAPLYEIIRAHQQSNTVVAASGLCFGARIAQEKLKVKLATVHLQPAMLRSVEDDRPEHLKGNQRELRRLLKGALFWMIDRFRADRLVAPQLNSFRASLGLPPVSRILKDYIHSPELVIGLFPEWFAPLCPDWPKNTHLTGFILHDDGERHQLNADVERFLDDGPPPLLITPGSAVASLADFFRESVEACRLSGQRAMLVTNFPEQLPKDLPAGVKAFSYLPFKEILPRCAAIVYTGGIGTMAQAIQAAIPHLVVPHVNDQPDNALRIERLGLGSRVLPKHYEASTVAKEIRRLVSSTETRARCSKYAAQLDSGFSLDMTCNLLTRLGTNGQPNITPGLLAPAHHPLSTSRLA